MSNLIEGEDYYIRPDGRLVFTDVYLLKRGFCCGNGCLHCPYEYERVQEPKRTQLLMTRQQDNEGKDGQ